MRNSLCSAELAGASSRKSSPRLRTSIRLCPGGFADRRASARSAPARSACASSPKYLRSATSLRIVAPCNASDRSGAPRITVERNPLADSPVADDEGREFDFRAGMSDEPRLIESTSDASERASQDNDVVWMPREKLRAICLTAIFRRQPRYPRIRAGAGGFASLPYDSFAKNASRLGVRTSQADNQELMPGESNAKVGVVNIFPPWRVGSCVGTAVVYML